MYNLARIIIGLQNYEDSVTVRLVHRYLKASELRRRIQHYGRLTIQPHSYTARTQQMVEVLRTRGIVG